jgi:ACS family hexuronate transporter-like MFS transporter
MNSPQVERYRWIILGTLFSLHVFTSVGQFSIPPLLPFIKKEMGLNYTQVGLFTSSYFFGIALTATFGGWMADSLGIRRMVVSGTFLMAIFMILAGWMPTFLGMISFLILAGICYSTVTPSTNKATMYWFHERSRATAMGIKQTGINGGGFLASFIIPPIALHFDWRYGFSFAGLLVLIGGMTMLIFYREIEPFPHHQMALHEWKKQIRKVVSNRNVLLLGFDGFFRVGVQNAFLTYLILYLQKILQLPVITASLFFGLAHACGAMGRITWGFVSDRVYGGERKKVYLSIALISGIALLVLGILPPAVPVWVVTLVVAILGFTTVGHQGVGLSFIAEVAGKELAGTASGFNQSFYFFGVVVMAPLFGFMVDVFETYTVAWMSLALFSFVASGFVAFVKEDLKKSPVARFLMKGKSDEEAADF